MTPEELEMRKDVIAHVRKGIDRALEFAANNPEDKMRSMIKGMDGPVETALMLGKEERYMYQEFRSFQFILDFIYFELYPNRIPKRTISLSPVHLGFIRGMLEKAKDGPRGGMIECAVIEALDPQIEKMYHHPDITNFKLP